MAIHGIKPIDQSGESNELAVDKMDDNQKKAMDIALQRAKERKRLEFLNRKNKG